MIRKITVPVRGDGKGDNVVGHAAILARRFNAHVEITHCRPRPEDLLPYGVPIPDFLRKQIREQATAVADIEEEGLRAELQALVVTLGLTLSDTPDGTKPTVSFVEESGRQVDVIRRHGRLADLVAVAKPDLDRNLGSNTLKAAIFNAGTPVLMCPARETLPSTLGSHLALAWNGSAQSARALSQALPLMRHAETVSLLSNGTDAGPGTALADAEQFLSLHGVKTRSVAFPEGKTVGKLLLETAKAEGADMLVMGAYSESHERETLFGGNTQVVVDTSEIPILFSH